MVDMQLNSTADTVADTADTADTVARRHEPVHDDQLMGRDTTARPELCLGGGLSL